MQAYAITGRIGLDKSPAVTACADVGAAAGAMKTRVETAAGAADAAFKKIKGPQASAIAQGIKEGAKESVAAAESMADGIAKASNRAAAAAKQAADEIKAAWASSTAAVQQTKFAAPAPRPTTARDTFFGEGGPATAYVPKAAAAAESSLKATAGRLAAASGNWSFDGSKAAGAWRFSALNVMERETRKTAAGIAAEFERAGQTSGRRFGAAASAAITAPASGLSGLFGANSPLGMTAKILRGVGPAMALGFGLNAIGGGLSASAEMQRKTALGDMGVREQGRAFVGGMPIIGGLLGGIWDKIRQSQDIAEERSRRVAEHMEKARAATEALKDAWKDVQEGQAIRAEDHNAARALAGAKLTGSSAAETAAGIDAAWNKRTADENRQFGKDTEGLWKEFNTGWDEQVKAARVGDRGNKTNKGGELEELKWLTYGADQKDPANAARLAALQKAYPKETEALGEFGGKLATLGGQHTQNIQSINETRRLDTMANSAAAKVSELKLQAFALGATEAEKVINRLINVTPQEAQEIDDLTRAIENGQKAMERFNAAQKAMGDAQEKVKYSYQGDIAKAQSKLLEATRNGDLRGMASAQLETGAAQLNAHDKSIDTQAGLALQHRQLGMSDGAKAREALKWRYGRGEMNKADYEAELSAMTKVEAKQNQLNARNTKERFVDTITSYAADAKAGGMDKDTFARLSFTAQKDYLGDVFKTFGEQKHDVPTLTGERHFATVSTNQQGNPQLQALLDAAQAQIKKADEQLKVSEAIRDKAQAAVLQPVMIGK